MTLDELNKLLAQFTYKDKFKVVTEPAGWYTRPAPDTYFLKASVWCLDADGSGKWNFVHTMSTFELRELTDWNEELVKVKVYKLVLSIEEHEINEWLRFDGKHVNDPHPELRK